LLSIACGFAFSSSYPWKYYAIIALLVGLIVIIVIFSRIEQTFIPENYRCPAVPLIPFISIFANFFMFGTVDLISWVITIIFCAIGVVIYLTYSLKFSVLGKKALLNTSDSTTDK
jgi:APA family basic amino acid/polyamine antiporter